MAFVDGRRSFGDEQRLGSRTVRSKKQGASPLRRKAKQPSAKADPRRLRAPVPAAARTKQRARRQREPLPWRQWGARALPAFAVVLVMGLCVGGWKLLDYVGSVPVSRVVVVGALQHVDRNALIARVRPHLRGAGFMTVDLDAIRADLEQMPWVDRVSVQRRWPDQLVIEVTEQEPIARWGEDGLLNRRGEVFRPKVLGKIGPLPQLYGPDNMAGAVVARYAQLRELLSAEQLTLTALGTDNSGSWSATLQDGVVLRFGTDDILPKMRRFLRVYRADLSTQMDRIAYIDLRYSNGLAVGWKAADARAAAHDNNTNSGVSGHG